MRILISGASGFIGSCVAASLACRGHEVVRLVRSTPEDGQVRWDPSAGTINAPGVEGFDGVVHLASMSWAGKWTPEFKQQIRENRLQTNGLVSKMLARCRNKPPVLICASGQGIYADAGDRVIPEDGPVGVDFLAQLQCDGEAATAPAAAAGIRVVHLRLPAVLGGANLRQTTANLRRLGSGRQWWSWVSRDEVASIVQHALTTPRLAGPVNAASPNPVTNAEFVETIARILNVRPAWPVSAFVLRMAMGEMADALVLASRRLEPRALISTGYQFDFPNLEEALRHELQAF